MTRSADIIADLCRENEDYRRGLEFHVARAERLRAMLLEARIFIDNDSPDWRLARLEILDRIDAVLETKAPQR